MRKILIILAGFLLVACGGGKTEAADDAPVVVIDPNSKDVIKMSDFVESVEYIQLEAAPEALLKHIDKVYLMDDRLFVADFMTKTVYIFDLQGKYLNKISKVGRAGNEYVSMDAVMFDPKKKEVIVYDIMTEKVLYYTLDGTCRKVIEHFGSENQATRYVRDMELLPNGNLLCCEYLHGSLEKDHRDGLWEMSPDGEFVRWVKQFDMVHPSCNPLFSLYYLDDGSIGWSPVEFEDDYSYDGKILKKLFSFDVKGPTAKDHIGVPNDKYFNPLPDKLFNSKVYTQYKKDYIFTFWGAPNMGEYYYSLYDRRTKNTKVGRMDYGVLDGVAALPTAFYRPNAPTFTVVNANIPGVIVSYVDPNLLFKEGLPTEMRKTIEKLTAGINEDKMINMNPILQFLHIK